MALDYPILYGILDVHKTINTNFGNLVPPRFPLRVRLPAVLQAEHKGNSYLAADEGSFYAFLFLIFNH